MLQPCQPCGRGGARRRSRPTAAAARRSRAAAACACRTLAAFSRRCGRLWQVLGARPETPGQLRALGSWVQARRGQVRDASALLLLTRAGGPACRWRPISVPALPALGVCCSRLLGGDGGCGAPCPTAGDPPAPGSAVAPGGLSPRPRRPTRLPGHAGSSADCSGPGFGGRAPQHRRRQAGGVHPAHFFVAAGAQQAGRGLAAAWFFVLACCAMP